jgi:hypothetical protein
VGSIHTPNGHYNYAHMLWLVCFGGDCSSPVSIQVEKNATKRESLVDSCIRNESKIDPNGYVDGR